LAYEIRLNFVALQDAADLRNQAAYLKTIQRTDVADIDSSIVRHQLVPLAAAATAFITDCQRTVVKYLPDSSTM